MGHAGAPCAPEDLPRRSSGLPRLAALAAAGRGHHLLARSGGYGYVSAYLPDDEKIPLCRLRYLGSDTDWGFALYRASSETYDDTLLPDGSPSGTPEQALDYALVLQQHF